MASSRNGSLEGSNCARIWDPCFTATKEGKLCLNCYEQEDGWKICESCEMASYTEASPSVPNHVDCSLTPSSCSANFNGEEILEDREAVALLNNNPQNLGNVTVEESPDLSKLCNPGVIFMFEKKLSATDCNPAVGRVLLPIPIVEKFFPMPHGVEKIPVVIRDTEERIWYLKLRLLPNGNSRKFVLEDTRKCLQQMNWTVGDTLKFYRRLSDGGVIMKCQKALSTAFKKGSFCLKCQCNGCQRALNMGASSSVPDHVDWTLSLSTLSSSSVNSNGLMFLFEKKLSLTDCNPGAGFMLVPIPVAEEFFPAVAGLEKIPVTILDLEGRKWYFNLHYKKWRKYVLHDTRSCVKAMNWNVGDTLQFYRRLSDGELVMDLHKAQASSSDASLSF